MVIIRRVVLAAVMALLALRPAAADQGSIVTPGAPLSMSGLASFLNLALTTVGGCFSGTTAPAASGSPLAYSCWADTSGAPTGVVLKWRDGNSTYVPIATINNTSHAVTLKDTVMPLPGASTLGAVFSLAATSNNFLTGLGTDGNFTRAQPSAANLSNGTTGTGAVVLANTPTLITPVLGAATGTSIALGGCTITGYVLCTTGSIGISNNIAVSTINGNTFTPGTGTLTIAAGKTLTASNSLTFTGTDSTSFAFPSTSGTVTTLAAMQTLTNKTLTAPTINGGTATALTSLGVRSTGTGAFDLTLANNENLTAGRTLTFVVNDAARTISINGNISTAGTFTTNGAFTLQLTATGATNVTLPTTGTLATLAGSEALTNKTINGLTITSSTGTLTIANGKTLTANNSIALSGTDGTTMTFPSTTATIARTDAGQTFTGNQAVTGTITGTSSGAAALSVGANGATNPAFLVDASTASSATGVSIKSAAAGAGVSLAAISSGTNENIAIDAKGSGTVTIGGVSTGSIIHTRATTLSAALTYGGVTLSNSVTGTGSMVLSAAPTITGHPTIEGVTSTGATGTGNLVFGTSPSLTTPTLGVASVTSVNKVTITAPATGSTLTIADGKTLTDTSGVGASILLGATGGGFAAYAGTSCTNQFPRSLSAAGVATCATVANIDLANSSMTFGSTSVSLGSTLSAATARGSSGFNNESLHQTGDTTVSIASTTRTEQTTTTLTAARTWTLPAASALNPGQSLIISDAAGAINGSNVINVTRAGSDTINGSTSLAMSTQYQQVTLISDGVSKWTYNAAGGGGGGGTVTSVAAGGGLSGGTITTSGTIAVLNSRNQVARFGGFDVWQRGTSLSIAASTTNAYQNDGWYVLTNANQASTVSQQSGIATGSLYSSRVQRNSGQTGTSTMRYAAPLDSDEIAPLQGSYVALSFTIKAGANWSPTSGTINYYIFCGTGAPAKRSTSAYTGETNVVSSSTNLTAGGSATRITTTSGAVWPTNCTQAEIQFFWDPTGTASTNDWVQFDDLQLEPVSGSSGVASPFMPVPMQQQLALAQRFFYQLNSPSTLAGMGFGGTFSTTSAFVTVPIPTTMRAVPTGIQISAAGDFGLTNATGGTVACSSMSFLNATLNGATVRCNVASGLVAGNATGLFGISASGTIAFTGSEI